MRTAPPRCRYPSFTPILRALAPAPFSTQVLALKPALAEAVTGRDTAAARLETTQADLARMSVALAAVEGERGQWRDRLQAAQVCGCVGVWVWALCPLSCVRVRVRTCVCVRV